MFELYFKHFSSYYLMNIKFIFQNNFLLNLTNGLVCLPHFLVACISVSSRGEPKTKAKMSKPHERKSCRSGRLQCELKRTVVGHTLLKKSLQHTFIAL